MEIYHGSHKYALAARVRRYSLLDLAGELLEVALEGLRRQYVLNNNGEDETIYLKPLQEIVSQGKCPADLLEERWEGEFGRDLRKLIDYSSYKLP